ncbi:MAG: hypothetical protein RIR31_1573 [Bacteroidota bacterium]
MLFHPIVCSTGNGYKDIQMMKNADVSIEIVNKNPEENNYFIESNGGDI